MAKSQNKASEMKPSVERKKHPSGEKTLEKRAASRRTSSRGRRKSASNCSIDSLGYRRLGEKPASYPVSFGDVLPQLIAKYGLARKLSITRFEETFKTILSDLFPHSPKKEDKTKNLKSANADLFSFEEESLGFIDEHSFRLIGFQAGTIQIEVASAPLLSESTFYQAEILRRFQEALPHEKIKRVRFTLK